MASPLTNTHIRTLQAVSYYVGAAVSKHTHLTSLSYYPLNEDHFPIAQKHVDSSQNDPLQIMSPVTLASAHKPSRAPHYSQNRSKIFSWPQSHHVMAFSCSFLSTVFSFNLWAPARLAWLTRRLPAQGLSLGAFHSYLEKHLCHVLLPSLHWEFFISLGTQTLNIHQKNSFILLCFPLHAHNYLFLRIHLTSVSYHWITNFSLVSAIITNVWKGLKNHRLDETKII